MLLLAVFLPPGAYAEDDEIIDVSEEEGEIIELEEEGEIPLTGEEQPVYQYQLGTRELPENVTWENGRLVLNFNWALIGEVGVQHGGQACACFSLAYCRTILDGIAYSYSDFSLGTSEEDAYASWTLGAYEGYFPTDRQSAYEFIFSELCRGKPVVIRVEGPLTSQHYVAVVGFENVTDDLPLSPYNFLIIDPGDPYYELENMGSLGLELKKEDGKYQVEYDTTSSAAPFVLNNSNYLNQCTESVMIRRLCALDAASVMSLPCDAETNAESRELVVLEEGECFSITAVIRNSRKECWYKGRTSDGVSGYVYAEKVAMDPLSGQIIRISSGIRLPFLKRAPRMHACEWAVAPEMVCFGPGLA